MMSDNKRLGLYSCTNCLSRSTNCGVVKWDRPSKAERDTVPLNLNRPLNYMHVIFVCYAGVANFW